MLLAHTLIYQLKNVVLLIFIVPIKKLNFIVDIRMGNIAITDNQVLLTRNCTPVRVGYVAFSP